MRPAVLLLALFLPLAGQAETIEIPVGEQGQSDLPLPRRGELKGAVLERFGLPDEEHAPVGQPPITRWDYREFSVYFEYDHVVDSVRHHQPRYLKEQQ
ncbi:phosphodiesterase [Pseudomonas alcaligenes]|uniref:Phosphodiesterase n=1 Tax=Aquipseudomonas alcaligenes TaxID=43263 RepID=A0ABR7S196_AQUAC|nr:phosphodiesterase [Pseudomonas alcaligenes]MBC9251361.1 phosphodiesterase [Pseudomonas alcaligenes]